MRTFPTTWFVFSIVSALSFIANVNVPAAETDVKPIRILLIGDSTVSTYAKPPADRPTLTGWGQVLGEFFTDSVQVLNHAKSGRSSKSFLAEGLWTKAIAEKPDYVFIQFGHNDSPGKGDRATDPNGDFQTNLVKYVDETRAVGGKPVLVTPVARRTFQNNQLTDSLQPYADAMKKVGREKEVPVIDLHAESMALYKRLGDEGSADFNPAASDRTHFSRKGANAMAQIVAAAVPTKVPDLKQYLKPIDTAK